MSDPINSEQKAVLDPQQLLADTASPATPDSLLTQQETSKIPAKDDKPISNSLAYFFDPNTKVGKFF